jgi:hypothetical protein
MPDVRRPRGKKPDSKQRKEAAKTLAIAALTFIAAEPERLGQFLAVTGIAPRSIREASREPNFLAGVLDHLAGDERLLLAFAEETATDPADVIRARDVLSGRHWERELP